MALMLVVVLVMPKLLQGMSPEVRRADLTSCAWLCLPVILMVCVSVSVCVARVGAAGAAEAVSERRRRRPHEEAAEAHGHGRRGGRRGRRPIAHNSHSLQRSVQTITYCFHIHSL